MNTEYILDLSEWKEGSVGVWGAVHPIYDTTGVATEKGIHVHARASAGGEKEIDSTYSRVEIVNWVGREETFVIHRTEAIHYMVAAIFDLQTKSIECPMCGRSHVDKDWFSVHPHQKHLCTYCNKTFLDKELGIGNPIGALAETLEVPSRQPSQGMPRTLQQIDFPGGIQLWGSNPAIFWGNQIPDNEGIHLHTFAESGQPIDDDTFTAITIDGLVLDPTMIRLYMAQSSLPHLRDLVCEMWCPQCGAGHFDRAESAYTPHQVHDCEHCGKRFKHDGKLDHTIGNPVLGALARLREMAPQVTERNHR